jgi:hypothetical protein
MKSIRTILVILISAPGCSEPSTGEMDTGSNTASDANDEPPRFMPCTQNLDAYAWCSTLPSDHCIRDWETAVSSAFSQICTGGLGMHPDTVEVCGTYNVLALGGTDIETDEYYDGTNGTLIAVTSTGNVPSPVCVTGPANFAPLPCSKSTGLCDLKLDSGVDAAAVGSDAANFADSVTE